MKKFFYLFYILIVLAAGYSVVDRNYSMTELPEKSIEDKMSFREEIILEGIVTSVLTEGAGGQFIVSTGTGLYIIVNLPGVKVDQGDRVRIYGATVGIDLPTPLVNALIIQKLR